MACALQLGLVVGPVLLRPVINYPLNYILHGHPEFHLLVHQLDPPEKIDACRSVPSRN
jgi:hypothetical protein